MYEAEIKTKLDERAKAWESAKEILDRCTQDKRERSAEENEMYERANADIERLGREIEEMRTLDRQGKENDIAREALAPLLPSTPDAQERAAQSELERYIRSGGQEGNGFDIDLAQAARMSQMIRSGASPEEVRAIYSDTGTSGTLVPTLFQQDLYRFMEASSAIFRISRVFTTSDGAPLDWPKVLAYGTATAQASQGTALTESDPTFSKTRFTAWTFGRLTKVATAAVQDTAVDVLGFIAEDIGRSLGRAADVQYALGDGTTEPEGIIVAAGTGVKTGGSLIPLTVEKLIDLQHSIIAEYRENASWVMNDLTAGTVRKFRDGAGGTEGAFLWEPSTNNGLQNGMPDRFLGSPVYTDTNFAAQASATRSVAYGDFSRFQVRIAGPVRVERSDERFFDTDEIGFRGVLRTDSRLVDANAIKTSSQLP